MKYRLKKKEHLTRQYHHEKASLGRKIPRKSLQYHSGHINIPSFL